MGCLFVVFLLTLCCTGYPIYGQTIPNTQPAVLQSECSTACPANTRCVQDNATVIWELFSSDECKSYQACYGSNSDYPDDTTNIFIGRLYPIIIALGSNLYFEAKYSNNLLRPFTIYNVSQAGFLDCSNALHMVDVLRSTVKVPDRFMSSVGYKFFIAKARRSYLACNFGLRLHVNVIDATNCSGTTNGNLCSGKGRCIAESFTGDIHCECCSGYTGQYCEEFNACSMDPCQRGNCTDVIGGHSEAFNCTCEAGYTGERCDIDINECDLPENTDACKNGGFCDDAVNSYVCLCLDGFHGDHCEFISNLCDFIRPCKNNANCSRVGSLKESYVCHCAPGFYGQNCTLNSTTSSLVPQLSSIPKTSSYQSTHSLAASVKDSYTISVNYQVTASSYFASVLQSTANTASQFYSSIKTNALTAEATRKLQTSIMVTSSSRMARHSSSNSLGADIITTLSMSQISATVTDISVDQCTTMKVEDTVSTMRTADATVAPSLSTSYFSANILSSSGFNVDHTLSQTMVHTTHSMVPSSLLHLPSLSTNQLEASGSISKPPSSVHSLPSPEMSTVVSITTNLQQTSPIAVSPSPSVIVTPLVSQSHQSTLPSSKPSATMATSMVTYPSLANTLASSGTGVSTHPTPQKSSGLISPSATMVTPSLTVVPTQPPLENQTCADHPCGEYGVCTNRDSSTSGLPFHCDCRYPTVGPVCTTDLELHFPYFNGKSFIEYKPIAFGSLVNEFVISFRTRADGTILFSGHRTYRDFMKLEVIGGLLRFSVDAGNRVVSVTSPGNVANGNITSASFGYDTRTGSVFMSVNNGAEQRATTSSRLRDVQLFYPLYLGGIVPAVYTQNKPDAGIIMPFVGCVRELEFNERAIELSDAVNWQNISECDVPACRVVPCKNAGVCVQNNEDVNDYTCQCVYPYSGKNCEEKYACEVNVCNGGKCLNSSMSGVQCLCPFGRGGLTCNQDIQVTIPTFIVVKNHSSYLQYLSPRGAVNQLDLRMEIQFSNHTKSRKNGLLFYVGLHDHLSVGSDGDYLALGVVDNRVVLQFNLGSGAVSVASGPLSSDQGWFTILAGRMGREGYLYVDNQVKEARSPPPLVGLNVFGRLYLGGVPEFSMLNNEVPFTEGFRGTIKDPKLRTGASNAWISLSMEHSINTTNVVPVITGLNIQDQKVNACVVGACLNNGSCESLGASYVCRCRPEWSGMTCNDTAVPCRDYNPCHGRSTCRTRDSGLTCDCPVGKAGRYCENDINITTPYFKEYSYQSFSLAKIKIHSQTSITLTFSSPAINGILFYITSDITSLSGDFLSITLHDRHVYLIYHLGSGIAKCKSQSKMLLNKNNNVTVTRDAKTSTLRLNGRPSTCTSRGAATQLNVASMFYLGGVPDLSQVQPLAYESSQDLRDFTGCVERLMINGHSFDLTQQGVLEGRNIGNCDTNTLLA